MNSSIPKWLLKIAPVPTVALAMWAGGCDSGKQSNEPPNFTESVQVPATQPVQSQDTAAILPLQAQTPPAIPPVQSQDVAANLPLQTQNPPATQPVQPKDTAAIQSVKSQDVAIDNFSFNPPTLTVAAGTTVTWVNHDDVPHTVTANDKAFNSKAMDTDDRFSHAFTVPGVYSYFCAVHPHMTGQIIVK